MAGDWIKFEKSTLMKPEVLRLASILNIHRYQAVGACLAFWSWCDDQLRECHARSVTETMIDDVVGVTGFAAALLETGWLLSRNGSIEVPNFDRHLSESAKNRSLSSNRQRKRRHDDVAKLSRSKRDKSATREEKRREENKDTPKPPEEKTKKPPINESCPLFSQFWSSYPRRVGKPKAALSFAALRPTEELLAKMLEALKWQKTSDQWTKNNGEFIPYPTTWLNARRWEDEPPSLPASRHPGYDQPASPVIAPPMVLGGKAGAL